MVIRFSSIKKIIKDAQRGKMCILVDDESRENEGDLIIPASKVSAKSINFMAKHGRGLICLALNSLLGSRFSDFIYQEQSKIINFLLFININ